MQQGKSFSCPILLHLQVLHKHPLSKNDQQTLFGQKCHTASLNNFVYCNTASTVSNSKTVRPTCSRESNPDQLHHNTDKNTNTVDRAHLDNRMTPSCWALLTVAHAGRGRLLLRLFGAALPLPAAPAAATAPMLP